jgi:hypothetical protein
MLEGMELTKFQVLSKNLLLFLKIKALFGGRQINKMEINP